LVAEASRNCEPPFPETIALEKVRRVYQRYTEPTNGGAVATKQQEFWPDVFTSKQLLELPEDETRWIWDRCLPVRSTSVLVAREYTGKSKFACSLALSVARGLSFLNRQTQKSAVLYVYLDGPIDELKENFQQIGMQADDQVFHYAGRRPDKITTWVTEHVRLHNVKLLIIDTMQKFFGFETGTYEERINIMQPFLDMVIQYDFHCMFTCHAAKNAGTISALGTVGTEANARTSLYLSRLPDSKQRIFQSQGNSGRNFEPVGLTDPMNGIIEVKGTMLEIQILDIEVKIKELIEMEPGLTETQIRLAAGAKGLIVNRALKSLRLKNEIERIGRGKKNDAFHYYLAGQLIHEPEAQKVVDLFGKKTDDN
jgi:hypothetical protein